MVFVAHDSMSNRQLICTTVPPLSSLQFEPHRVTHSRLMKRATRPHARTAAGIYLTQQSENCGHEA
ncbi:hypothetical protein U9M48_006142, partial [Paspalum notatum var. saurae]